MISAGIRILPTSWRSAVSSALRRCRAQAEAVGHGEGERDDLPAVVAGVLVVRLDDVSEEKGGAPVGVPELESVVDRRLRSWARKASSAGSGRTSRSASGCSAATIAGRRAIGVEGEVDP